ncbi:MAG TPA: ATP-binding protein, partial [Thermoanaerobaculia bacterium]
MSEPRILPVWAEDLRRRYLRGEASIFVLHGNVYDSVISGNQTVTLSDFLAHVLLKETKDTVAIYNVAAGVRFAKRNNGVSNLDELLLSTEKPRVLGAIERMLIGGTRTAVVLEYAEAIAPAGDPNFQSEADRAAIVTLHRWSFLPEIERSDNVVVLISENLTELAGKLVSNPKVAVVEIPMPDADARKAAAHLADKRLSDQETERYAEVTAGLKAIQIISILTPPPATEEESRERESFIARLLAGPDAPQRAKKLAALTAGLNEDEITKLLAPGARPIPENIDRSERARQEIDTLIARRKREILERECFGLIEFVEPQHGFDVVGGMDEVKKDLMVIAKSIRDG